MKVVPLEMYEHFMASVRSPNNEQEPSSSRDTEESALDQQDHMEVDPGSPQVSSNSNGQPEELVMAKDNNSQVNTFPEWKEYSDKSTQTEPKKRTRSKKTNQRYNGKTKRRRRR